MLRSVGRSCETQVTAIATGPGTIDLAWSEQSAGVTGFTIQEFVLNPGNHLNVDQTSFLDAPYLLSSIREPAGSTGATLSVTPSFEYTGGVGQYVFTVTAQNTAGSSNPSASTTPLQTPPDPSVQVADAPVASGGMALVNSNEVVLYYPPQANGGEDIEISVGADEPSNLSIVDTSGDSVIPLQQPETTYSLRVRPYNAGGYSDWSAPQSFTTPSFTPDAPASYAGPQSPLLETATGVTWAAASPLPTARN